MSDLETVRCVQCEREEHFKKMVLAIPVDEDELTYAFLCLVCLFGIAREKYPDVYTDALRQARITAEEFVERYEATEGEETLEFLQQLAQAGMDADFLKQAPERLRRAESDYATEATDDEDENGSDERSS